MSGMNTQGRPTGAGDVASSDFETYTGNRGLRLEEPLIFELDNPGATGVDLDEPAAFAPRLGTLERKGRIGLPGISEPDVMRHYVRLSRKNYSIDAGLYPLGSCTMKHNPRLNEKMARLPGFGDVHPLQPQKTVQGALELMDTLAHWLKELTGMPAVAMSPKAGAHGELCGMMAIRAALVARGEGATRTRILVLNPRMAPIRRRRRCCNTRSMRSRPRRTVVSISRPSSRSSDPTSRRSC